MQPSAVPSPNPCISQPCSPHSDNLPPTNIRALDHLIPDCVRSCHGCINQGLQLHCTVGLGLYEERVSMVNLPVNRFSVNIVCSSVPEARYKGSSRNLTTGSWNHSFFWCPEDTAGYHWAWSIVAGGREVCEASQTKNRETVDIFEKSGFIRFLLSLPSD